MMLVLLAARSAAASDPTALANAAVPPEYRRILSFELKAHSHKYGSFDAIVPSGWRYDPDTQTYTPPPTQLPPHGKLIGFSSMRISSTCAGTCADKDWASVIDKKVQEYRDKGYAIERDETPKPGQRLLVSKHADKRIYARFFSKSGGNRYFVCEAEVDRFAEAAEAAFDAACTSLIIHNWQ
jgi:hypothetical protein